MAVLEFLQRGGFFMWPMLLLAIVGAILVAERMVTVWRSRLDVGQFLTKLRSLFKNSGPDAVLAFCAQGDVPVANVVRQGVLRHGRTEEHVSRVLASARAQELFRLRRGIPLLTGIGGAAALLGLLGTVVGVIAALRGVQGQGGAATLADIAGSLWPALVTTAVGLAVGLFCFASEKYLVASVDRLRRDMEIASTELMDLLAETRTAGPEQRRKDPSLHHPAIADYEDEFFRRKS
jgi:biopolymer transport protein ExbB